MDDYIPATLEVSMPTNLENLALPHPDLLDYYKDRNDRVMWLEGEVGDTTVGYIKDIYRINREDRGKAPEERTPIKLFIDSQGGDVNVMWSLIGAIKISKTPVYTIAVSRAESAAAHILASGHKRFALPGTTVLIHSGYASYQGAVEKIESVKKYMDNLCKEIDSYLVERTKILPKDIKKYSKTDWYLSAEEALKYGVVDCIVSDFDEVM